MANTKGLMAVALARPKSKKFKKEMKKIKDSIKGLNIWKWAKKR